MSNTQKSTNMVAIITMCFIFAMISFVTNMAAPFGVIWGNQYEWSKMAGNLMILPPTCSWVFLPARCSCPSATRKQR